MPRDKGSEPAALARNRRARFEYTVLETWEAGLELTGGEVKSCRAGTASLAESFAAFDDAGKQIFLRDMRVQPYLPAGRVGFEERDPARPKRLLMHRGEIAKRFAQVREKGLAIVPLKLYVARGRIKVELALVRGKLQGDKRQSLKEKTAKRELDRLRNR